MRHPRRPVLALAAFVTLMGPAAGPAQPVPDAQRIPVDIRRSTLIVRDMDRSLAFWRDALGLTVVYDRMIGQPPDDLRLVLLRANDSFIGAIGLLERQAAKRSAPPARYERASFGDVIIVVNAWDLETRLERIRQVPGVRIEGDTRRVEYPASDGKGTIPVLVTYLWDPDGYVVEVNKILGKPAGSQ